MFLLGLLVITVAVYAFALCRLCTGTRWHLSAVPLFLIFIGELGILCSFAETCDLHSMGYLFLNIEWLFPLLFLDIGQVGLGGGSWTSNLTNAGSIRGEFD